MEKPGISRPYPLDDYTSSCSKQRMSIRHYTLALNGHPQAKKPGWDAGLFAFSISIQNSRLDRVA